MPVVVSTTQGGTGANNAYAQANAAITKANTGGGFAKAFLTL